VPGFRKLGSWRWYRHILRSQSLAPLWLGLFGLVLYGVLWLAVVASLGASAGVHGSVPWWFVLVLLFVGGLAVFAVMARALLTILSNLRSPNLRAAINAKRTAMRAS